MSAMIYRLQRDFHQPERLSLSELAGDLLEHLEHLDAMIEAAERAADRFERLAALWPDQCERVLRPLQALSEALQPVSRLLDSSAHLPLSVVPLRYELTVTLHYLSHQIQQICAQLQELRTVCRSSSRRTTALHQELRRKLPALFTQLGDLRAEFTAMLDRARFRELVL